MRGWIPSRAQSFALPQSAWPCTNLRLHSIRLFRSSCKLERRSRPRVKLPEGLLLRKPQKYPLFERISRPEHTVDAWTALLDGALPPHLREQNVTPPNSPLSAADVAQVLLAAQYPDDPTNQGLNLLDHLGCTQDRWSAVVWLVKKLVDRFPAQTGQSTRLSDLNHLWQQQKSYATIDELVDVPIELFSTGSAPLPETLEAKSIEELVGTHAPENYSRAEKFQHDALGQIWLALGTMTKSCAGGEIRPEVLEILAYLHHREVMPASIYQAEPHFDTSAVQQPPLLPFLSSRILTSLSDAAWRAHEKLVIEEARANGSQYAQLRPEIPGSVFRVHVAGLRPEVWMELILWSCLSGGWVQQGLELLQSLLHERNEHNGNQPWKLLSWTEYQKQLPENFHNEPRDWRSWEYIFKTRKASSMDSGLGARRDIRRTISGEVVTAYVDALICDSHIGVGYRGFDVELILANLLALRGSLVSNKLALGFGTWDAASLRVIDNRSIDPEMDTSLMHDLSKLSRGFGEGLYEQNTQELPAYVLDSTIAMQGLLHRTLVGQLRSGSIEGALAVFRTLQVIVDENKRKSLIAFFGHGQNDQNAGMFSSNFHGIDYPGSELQIPTTILGPLLHQITQSKDFDLARWLILPTAVDEPVIPENLFNDPFIQPALIELAGESADRDLLARFMQSKMNKASLRAIYNTLVDRLQWDTAHELLLHIGRTPGSTWGYHDLASLIRIMLTQRRLVMDGYKESEEHATRAEDMFRAMVSFKYDTAYKVRRVRLATIQTILSILSTVNDYWTSTIRKLRIYEGKHDFVLRTRNFNRILEGVVVAYGSAAGRRLVDKFWPHDARSPSFYFPHGIKRMPRWRPDVLDEPSRQRVVIDPVRREGEPEHVIYGALDPNVDTILIVLRKALEEVETCEQKVAAEPAEPRPTLDPEDSDREDPPFRNTIRWALRQLTKWRYVDHAVIEELDKSLTERGLDDMRTELEPLKRPSLDDTAGEAAETIPDAAASEGNHDKVEVVATLPDE